MRNVDYYIGSSYSDVMLGGSGSDLFDANLGDYDFNGAGGYDVLTVGENEATGHVTDWLHIVNDSVLIQRLTQYDDVLQTDVVVPGSFLVI